MGNEKTCDSSVESRIDHELKLALRRVTFNTKQEYLSDVDTLKGNIETLNWDSPVSSGIVSGLRKILNEQGPTYSFDAAIRKIDNTL